MVVRETSLTVRCPTEVNKIEVQGTFVNQQTKVAVLTFPFLLIVVFPLICLNLTNAYGINSLGNVNNVQ